MDNPLVKIKLGKANVFCLIKFDLESQKCGLCRKTLNFPTDEELNTIGINYHPNVTVTACKHGFHKDCLKNYCKEETLSCPSCGVMFVKKDDIITSNLITNIYTS